MAVEIRSGTPTPDQWMRLRASVGWASFAREVAQKSLDASLYCVCAFDGDELVGMARVLGDGVFSFYIGNVMVLPQRQSEGIGRLIMQEIMAYVDRSAQPGAIASLMSIKGKEGFYLQFGFQTRPDGEHGSGMSRYYD